MGEHVAVLYEASRRALETREEPNQQWYPKQIDIELQIYTETFINVSEENGGSIGEWKAISDEIHLERLSTDCWPCLNWVSTDYQLSNVVNSDIKLQQWKMEKHGVTVTPY